ncbi:kinase-like domain-containing protein [Butyriboletus roseoflavus]|nr:kinase-like domain-containing protein [Butyriboletus roseoflavus]
MKRELGLWKRLRHPNIVPLLGTARGEDFASDHPCMVSMWMPHGTLAEYVRERENKLSLPSRIQLITGSAAGLEFLHSMFVVHMDFHPANILIDNDHNPRLTDFGLSQTLSPERDQWSYLWTTSVRAGAMLWAAPEVLYPELYPALKDGATLDSDIYSLGSIIRFILSGKFPWKNSAEVQDKLREFQNPPRPAWPANIPDGVWNFIEKCWSPRQPRNRPSAQEVLVFSRDKLEQLFQPNPTSDINVVLFGALGCGKSSIINLLAEEPIAQISIGERRYRLWDTMGFRTAHGEDTSHLLPYEQAHAVLRKLRMMALYRLINDFFYGGRAPVAFVLTHFDMPDEQWWKHNQHIINRKTGIPVQSIPHACVTTTDAGRDQSKQTLEALLRTFAATIAPTAARSDHLSHTAASRDLAAHFGLSTPEAKALVEKFRQTTASLQRCTLWTNRGWDEFGHQSPCWTSGGGGWINTGMQQFHIWDTVGFSERCFGNDAREPALANAAQLIHGLSGQGGVDLLVYCRHGRFTELEQNIYRLFEEFLCEGQVPVAVVVTHLEWQNQMEKWWEINGEVIVKAIGGDVIGHACITSLASDHASAIGLKKQLSESRLSVQVMLEDCVSILAKSPLKRHVEVVGTPKRMTVPNLMNRCGLTKGQAEEFIRLRYGSGPLDVLSTH